MRTSVLSVLIILTFALLTGCSDGSDSQPQPGPYADESLWLCKPGASANRCLELDQQTTEVYSNTSSAVFDVTPAVDPGFDCFYVYPTVDLREEPGNTLDLTDDTLMLRPLYNQAARFVQLCNVYAPKYRQMTIGTYGVEGGYRSSENFELAFSDVDAAFSQYLDESNGRPFVLFGHSQGSHMLIELLKQRFENNPELRARLISALVIGPVGALDVPPGEIAGGTFDNIPLCTHATDYACIIAYDTIANGTAPHLTELSLPIPCVNPTLLGGNPGVLENTIWETSNGMPFPASIETHWAAYPALHTAQCDVTGYLNIDTLEEERLPPLSPQLVQLVLASNSLHVADVSYTIGDLLRIVATQAESLR